LQKLEGKELNRFERWRDQDEAEQEEERHEELEDLDAVADEKYNGLSGKMFRRQANRLRKLEFKEKRGSIV